MHAWFFFLRIWTFRTITVVQGSREPREGIVVGVVDVVGTVVLPVAAERMRLRRLESASEGEFHARPVVLAPVVLAPDGVVGVVGQILARDVVVRTDLEPPHPREERFHQIGGDRSFGVAF